MNLWHLSVFREVMKTGSMSEAALNLGRTQPAISLALKSLEETLGIKLFDRDTRNLKPVPEAHYLLTEAESVLNQMTQLERTMQRMQMGDEGETQMAVMPGVATVVFPEFLCGFVKGQPDISLSLHTRSSTQLRELVNSQGVDFGFGDFDDDHSRTLHTKVTRISAESFIALPRHHPLVDRDIVKLSELDGETFGGMQPNHRFEHRVQTALDEAGVTTKVRIRSQTILPLLKFVGAEECCAIVDPLTVVSAQLIGSSDDEVVFRRLDHSIRYDYAILSPKLRRLSALSRKLATEWERYLLELLTDLKVAPRKEVLE